MTLMGIAECGLRILCCLTLPAALAFSALGQIPEPGPAKSVNIPAVKESKLKNGLTVAVVEKRSVPIVTVQLLVKSGASSEEMAKAGLADMTATLLTKGTKTRTAEQIAEEVEFLGASISTTAGWNNSSVTISVTSDKLEQAIRIMADVVLNPSFTQKELDLLKTQALDRLKYNLTQPSFLATYVASVHSFKEHPADGTASSIESLTQRDLQQFYRREFRPGNSVLIFAGDITFEKAISVANARFGKWAGHEAKVDDRWGDPTVPVQRKAFVKRILVVDLPASGQASVNFFKSIIALGRGDGEYYTAAVLNSLLGGGYSSRLNQEIRIKRGLSYGASSSFGWRSWKTNFSARTQTKNESAAEVAELVIAELKRLAETDAAENELNPRQMALTGGFGLNLETTSGLAGALAELYMFGIQAEELNRYMPKVKAVSSAGVKSFAAKNLYDGDLIIAGDYSAFKDDLAKRFPNMKIDLVKAHELNIESPTLKRADVP